MTGSPVHSEGKTTETATEEEPSRICSLRAFDMQEGKSCCAHQLFRCFSS